MSLKLWKKGLKTVKVRCYNWREGCDQMVTIKVAPGISRLPKKICEYCQENGAPGSWDRDISPDPSMVCHVPRVQPGLAI